MDFLNAGAIHQDNFPHKGEWQHVGPCTIGPHLPNLLEAYCDTLPDADVYLLTGGSSDALAAILAPRGRCLRPEFVKGKVLFHDFKTGKYVKLPGQSRSVPHTDPPEAEAVEPDAEG